MKKINVLLLSSLLLTNVAFATQQSAAESAWTSMTAKTSADTAFKNQVLQAMNDYYSNYHTAEYFSGMSVAIYVPQQGTQSFYIGTVTQDPNSAKIDQNTLFDIGSITKSFTAAIILQLQKQQLLSLNDTVGKWLPEYSKWGSVTIEQLLNMTSGLPNYSNSATVNYKFAENLATAWSNKELLSIVYPPANLNPPGNKGYDYTNTGYLLAAMIADKASKSSYSHLLQNLIQTANLQNTFYPVPEMSNAVKDRMAHGYAFNPNDNPELVGKDISSNNLSWAGAAGAIVSNSADIIQWVNALFVGNNILDAQQKQQLTSLVSIQTGEPIKHVSSSDPAGFALGVASKYVPNIGSFWFYEGETLGFRAIYMYVPSNGAVIAININSRPVSDNDHVAVLMQSLYKIVTSTYKLQVSDTDKFL